MEPFSRSSGILLHPTSLPGPHGIGDLGPSAYKFLDFLAASGQTWWQMLPVNPPGFGESPYSALSSLAGNPLLISLEMLRDEGLLSDYNPRPSFSPIKNRIDFQSVRHYKHQSLWKAFENFKAIGHIQEFNLFIEKNKKWLNDFVLFQAIKNNQQGKSWTDWPKNLRTRNKVALAREENRLANEIFFYEFLQWTFFRQWSQLKKRAAKLKIKLMGDVPIFVAHDSADVWHHQKLFKLNANGHPSVRAGVPPDYFFSKTGQLWGNPLYRWSEHKKDQYDWWTQRLKITLDRFDVIRLDHFIGFYRAWEVPARDKTAENGQWVLGPRASFFSAVLKKLRQGAIVAENLGAIIPPIEKLRKKFKIPGMVVLHFIFAEGPALAKKQMADIGKNTLVYTGTHDNNTSVGWLNEVIPWDLERRHALAVLQSDGREINWDLIKLALSSKADLAIVPLQDVLGLGEESRMNRPGSTRGNWAWRFEDGDLTKKISDRLLNLAQHFDRT